MKSEGGVVRGDEGKGGGGGDGRLMQRVSARTGWRQWVLEQPSKRG